jgi:O-methyltransferase
MVNINKRYIELLKKSLINELYIENEAKLFYIIKCLFLNENLSKQLLVNPEKIEQGKLIEVIKEGKNIGQTISLQYKDSAGKMQYAHHLRNYLEFPHSMIGRKRMDNLQYCIETVLEKNIPGDLIETGVWRGGATIFMRGMLSAYNINDRNVWVADSFEGLPPASLKEDEGINLTDEVYPVLSVSLDNVKELFSRYDLLDEQVKFLKGWFKDTLMVAPIKELSILRLDGDLYESTMDALNALYDKVSIGGFIIVDDYNALKVCKMAIQRFRQDKKIHDELIPIDDSSVYWVKSKM